MFFCFFFKCFPSGFFLPKEGSFTSKPRSFKWPAFFSHFILLKVHCSPGSRETQRAVAAQSYEASNIELICPSPCKQLLHPCVNGGKNSETVLVLSLPTCSPPPLHPGGVIRSTSLVSLGQIPFIGKAPGLGSVAVFSCLSTCSAEV